MLGVGANRDGIGTQACERLVQPFETRQTGKLGFKVVAIGRARRAKTYQFKTVDRSVGTGVAGSHCAETNHENADTLRARNG
jgi:hypothetical protein